MSIVTPWEWRRAIQASALPSTTKFVLLNLAVYMDQNGDGMFPSTIRQANDTGLSERAICTHLDKATQAGFIQKQIKGNAGRDWKRHEYTPFIPEGTERRSAPHQQGTERGSVRNCEGTEPNDIEALNDVQSNTTKNTTIENTPKGATPKAGEHFPKAATEETRQPKAKREYTPDFLKAWEAYPTSPNMPKADGFKVWTARISEGHSPEALLETIDHYKAGLAADTWRKPQHFSTFFGNQKRTFEGFLESQPEEEPAAAWSDALAAARETGDGITVSQILAATKANDYDTANKIGREYFSRQQSTFRQPATISQGANQ